jgi:hypothetical protein
MSATITPTLDRLFQPLGQCLTPEVARALVDLRADSSLQNKLDDLAEKNTAGQLTAEERDEYDMYLAAISVVTVLQSKARLFLASREQ